MIRLTNQEAAFCNRNMRKIWSEKVYLASVKPRKRRFIVREVPHSMNFAKAYLRIFPPLFNLRFGFDFRPKEKFHSSRRSKPVFSSPEIRHSGGFLTWNVMRRESRIYLEVGKFFKMEHEIELE
ncbi:hypothetical protein NPIL_465751 [Nephila pilipes]|uniref:Uncharacterized protein n=1 Tax=Nephila pilipes TaxID=299642 RepID=A0A8X6PNH2_NEPPI|nr:hypothetical protein NPIL_465751 [Nephila pilipes]